MKKSIFALLAAVVIACVSGSACSVPGSRPVNSDAGSQSDESSYSSARNDSESLSESFVGSESSLESDSESMSESEDDTVANDLKWFKFVLLNDGSGYSVSKRYDYKEETYPKNISIPGVYNGKPVTSIHDNAFYYCDSLKSVELPGSITTIGRCAFIGCGSLTSIEIPDGAISIGEGAFSRCIGLTNMTIPDSVRSIGMSAFSDCNDSIYTRENGIIYVDKWAVGVENGQIASANIKVGTKGIANNVFSNCDNLASVVIPDSVITMGSYAFYGCRSLTNIVIPNSVKIIERGMFSECDKLTSVGIPVGVTTIAGWAFSDCVSLTDIEIPVGVTDIGESAF